MLSFRNALRVSVCLSSKLRKLFVLCVSVKRLLVVDWDGKYFMKFCNYDVVCSII